MQLAETTHMIVDHTKHTIEAIIYIIESKEHLIATFEMTGGKEIHEHRVLHASELMFSRVMMMMGG